jgi:carboxymethylenebutenolidase
MTASINLSPAQHEMVRVWEKHTTSEFRTKSIDDTMATMTSDPHVNHVPVMTGGVGHEALAHFYSVQFIPGQPPGTSINPVSRLIGPDFIVEELIHRFTHTIEMPWILPGIAPTGKPVELAVVAIVRFRDGKIASEHIYWDQACVLAQIGLLDTNKIPITGAEQARKAVDPTSIPSNQLIARTKAKAA